MIVAHNCKYTRIYWILHFNGVNFMVCELYLKSVKSTEVPWTFRRVSFNGNYSTESPLGNPCLCNVQTLLRCPVFHVLICMCVLCSFITHVTHVDLCNHHHSQIQNSVPLPQGSLCYPGMVIHTDHFLVLPTPPPSSGPEPLAASNLLSVSILFQKGCTNGVIQYVTFWDWLFHLV